LSSVKEDGILGKLVTSKDRSWESFGGGHGFARWLDGGRYAPGADVITIAGSSGRVLLTVLIIILKIFFELVALKDSRWERFGGVKILAGRLDSSRLAPRALFVGIARVSVSESFTSLLWALEH